MALSLSGRITLSDVQTEFGGSDPIRITEYYRGGSYVVNAPDNASIPTSGNITLSNFHGTRKVAPRSFSLISTSNGTSGTFSLINAPDPYRWIICTHAAFNGNPITIPTAPVLNGVAMTTIATQRSDARDDGHVAGIWAIKIATGTTVSWTASNRGEDSLAFYEVTGIIDPVTSTKTRTSTTSNITVPSLPAFVLGTAVSNFSDAGGPTAITGMTNALKTGAALTAYDSIAELSNTYPVVSIENINIQLKAAFVYDW